MLTSLKVDAVLKAYGFPPWLKPYLVRYMDSSDKDLVRHSIAFLKYGRKKGAITAKEVRLPNGSVFYKDDIVHLLNLFYYGEERIGQISGAWARSSDGNKYHADYFKFMQQLEEKRARAIKNFVLGLGHKMGEPSKELISVFDYVESIADWNERMVAKRILLGLSYVNPIGEVFYRVFYPVSSEFLRPLANVFINKNESENEGTRIAEAAVREGKIEEARLLQLSEDVLVKIAKSIKAEMPRAKKAGIGKEAELLMQVAVAHPLYRLRELGVKIEPEKELKKIWKKV